MSISTTDRKAGPFVGNGVTTTFDFEFKVFSTADVLVVKTDLTDVETELTLTTHYTVSLNPDQDDSPGGTVTLLTAPASGIKITLTSQVAELQPVELTNAGGFYPAVVNTALDRLTILVQQLSEKVGRSFKVGISSTATPDELIQDLQTASAEAATAAAEASAAAAEAAIAAADAAAAAATVDTSLFAPKESPTFTGTPTVPTAASDTNTTQAASTAFVIGQASDATPQAGGTAAAGTSKKFSRADHVHPESASGVTSVNGNTGAITAAQIAAAANSGNGGVANHTHSYAPMTAFVAMSPISVTLGSSGSVVFTLANGSTFTTSISVNNVGAG